MEVHEGENRIEPCLDSLGMPVLLANLSGGKNLKIYVNSASRDSDFVSFVWESKRG